MTLVLTSLGIMGLLDKLTEFANETSIHGLAFVGQDSSSKTKRLIWAFLFIGFLTYAGLQLKIAIICKFNVAQLKRSNHVRNDQTISSF